MAELRDKSESNSQQTRGRVGPVAGRAPSVTPSTSRTQERISTDPSQAEESGSPGAMEDEEDAKRQP